MTFKYFNDLSPSYLNDVFKTAGQRTTNTRMSLLKLNQPLRKTNHGQKSIYYVVLTILNKSPDTLKIKENVNRYKHRVKKLFFHRMKEKESDKYNYF